MPSELEPTHIDPLESTLPHIVEKEEPVTEYLAVPSTVISYTTGGHEHVWVETDELRDDTMMTAICTSCGSGMHYHSSVHSVTDGKLNNHV